MHASLALPADTPAPAVLLIHEWWGLNDQIKAVAGELARQGYMALAVDLYDGNVATASEEAERLRKAVDAAVATDTLVSWVEWLRKHPKGTGKVATIGWCFGGGWSLNASIATPVDATIIYYGQVDQPASRLARLQGPVLGHFATRDQRINRPMVEGFEKAMAEAGKPLTVYWYEADHAFANPTGRVTMPKTPSSPGIARSRSSARTFRKDERRGRLVSAVLQPVGAYWITDSGAS